MQGAELLIRVAIRGGIQVCFANPGTTELPIVTAFDRVPGIKTVLGLFEGVCTGAADGYGRILERPAMTLLHLGPGFANGIANLHNARRAQSPVLNVIGEHATWHRKANPPLAMDIEGLARTVSGWVRTVESVHRIGNDVAEALAAARIGQVATLVMPHDFQLAESSGDDLFEIPSVSLPPVEPNSIETAAKRLKACRKAALLLGGKALRGRGLYAAGRIKSVTGCRLFAPSLFGYMERGSGLPSVDRIPYFPEQATALFSDFEVIVLAGVPEPVTFFGYPGIKSSILSDQQEKIVLCTEHQDVAGALEELAEALGAPRRLRADNTVFTKPNRPPLPKGELTPEKVCLTLAALQPEGAVIVDEAVTTRSVYFQVAQGVPFHSFITVSGGSIGQGIPCATGAAIASPDRPVINLEADGSAMYTIQGLWTQAREGLNVTTLICSNRSYRILQIELARSGITSLGHNARALMELQEPVIDWVAIARGFGVPGVRVNSAENLAKELGKALAEPGPHLIEMVLP